MLIRHDTGVVGHLRFAQPRARRAAGGHGRVPRRGRPQNPRPRVGGHRQPRRQPVLPGRHAEGGSRPGRAVPPHRRRRPGGPPDTTRRSPSASRTASSTGRPKCGSPSSVERSSTTWSTCTWRRTTSPGWSPSWPATSPRSGRWPPCSRTTRRRSSSPTDRSGPGSTRRRVPGSTWCRPSRWPTRTPRSGPATPSTPAPAWAAAEACSPTTRCRRSSPCSASNRCTWCRRRRTIRAG